MSCYCPPLDTSKGQFILAVRAGRLEAARPGLSGRWGQGDSANGRNFRVARGSETAAPNSGETVNSRVSGVISVFPVIRHAGVAENKADQFRKTCLGPNIV